MPIQMAQTAFRTAMTATNIIRRRRAGKGGMAAPLTAPRTHFNTTITPRRRIAYAHMPLEDVKTIKNAFGVKVNDVVLAIASGAVRRYLLQENDLPAKSLIATCPVSVRTEEEMSLIGSNRVSAMFTTLASNLSDPVERLMAIAEVNNKAKEEHGAVGADMLQNWMEFAAPTTFSMAARMYSGLRISERHPVVHNLVISNVPGPNTPLYFAGAKLVALYPLGPIFDGAALNITVLSYLDTIYWGFIAGREAMPHLWDLAGAVPDALAELLKAARELQPA
jgi:WS/DGAT/MGAT family acyltransferase